MLEIYIYIFSNFGLKHEYLTIKKHICNEDYPEIISTHDVLYCELEIPVQDEQLNQVSNFQYHKIEKRNLDWENADISLYQLTLDKLLEHNFEIWKHPENIQILATLIPTSFVQAAEHAAPVKKVKNVNFKVQKSEDWRKAEITANRAAQKWKQLGKPREPKN